MIKLIDKIRRAIIQFKMVSIRNGWKKAEFLKKKNIFHHIGEHSFYQSTYLPAEPFLVSIGNNVAISAGVRLITHSAAHVILIKRITPTNIFVDMARLKSATMYISVQM